MMKIEQIVCIYTSRQFFFQLQHIPNFDTIMFDDEEATPTLFLDIGSGLVKAGLMDRVDLSTLIFEQFNAPALYVCECTSVHPCFPKKQKTLSSSKSLMIFFFC